MGLGHGEGPGRPCIGGARPSTARPRCAPIWSVAVPAGFASRCRATAQGCTGTNSTHLGLDSRFVH